MKTRFLIIFLFAAYLPALAQLRVTSGFKRPTEAGVTNMRIDSIGRLRAVNIGSGPEFTPKVDSSAVIGLGTKLRLVDANINARTAYQSVKALRTSNLPSAAAPGVISITDSGKEGDFILDLTDKTTPDNTGTVLVTANKLRYKRRTTDGYINVKWWGAKGDKSINDSPAIQAAIDYAKNRILFPGANVRMEVVIPDGAYYLEKTINITDISGLTVRGGGKYINVILEGDTGGPIFDCSGMTMGKIQGISFVSTTGFVNRSTIGIQFALTQDKSGNQLGGLNNSVSDCYFQLDDNPTANGGIGTIGILNFAAEEFSIRNSTIRANCGALFSFIGHLGATGHTYIVNSPFAIIAKGARSMSAVEISDNVSIQNYQKRSPALIFNSCAAIKAFVYLARTATTSGAPATLGAEERAIAFYGQTDNVDLQGNVENFSTIASFGTNNNMVSIKMVTSNQVDKSKPFFDATGLMEMNDTELKVSPTVLTEYNNGRRFIYYPPISGGDSISPARITNCKFSCTGWQNNALFVTGNFLKKCNNCDFNTRQPFTKRGRWIENVNDITVTLGTMTTGNPDVLGDLIRFTKADRTTIKSGNIGYYRAIVEGTITLGDYNTAKAYADFRSVINYAQNPDGSTGSIKNQTVITSAFSTNSAIVNISDIAVNFAFDGYGHIQATVKNSGSGLGKPIKFEGKIIYLSDFAVNESIPLQ